MLLGGQSVLRAGQRVLLAGQSVVGWTVLEIVFKRLGSTPTGMFIRARHLYVQTCKNDTDCIM